MVAVVYGMAPRSFRTLTEFHALSIIVEHVFCKATVDFSSDNRLDTTMVESIKLYER